jgi:hypothetical protein
MGPWRLLQSEGGGGVPTEIMQQASRLSLLSICGPDSMILTKTLARPGIDVVELMLPSCRVMLVPNAWIWENQKTLCQ